MNEENAVAAVAHTAAITKLSDDWEHMLALGVNVSQSKIKFVNLGREIGLGLQGLCQHEQIKLSFYENIKASLPASLTFAAAQRCIHLANNLAGPVTTVEEANQVEAQLLLAGGFMEVVHRVGSQASHDSTPDTFIFTTLATAKDRLLKKISEAASWDTETRASVWKQVEQFEATLALVKAKLQGEETA